MNKPTIEKRTQWSLNHGLPCKVEKRGSAVGIVVPKAAAAVLGLDPGDVVKVRATPDGDILIAIPTALEASRNPPLDDDDTE
jgi:antitoxin component of MazEF toxin-antitoxin module